MYFVLESVVRLNLAVAVVLRIFRFAFIASSRHVTSGNSANYKCQMQMQAAQRNVASRVEVSYGHVVDS